MCLTKEREDGIQSVRGSVKSFDQMIRLDADVLSPGADELGGVSGILNSKLSIDNFQTEYIVVVSPWYLIELPRCGV